MWEIRPSKGSRLFYSDVKVAIKKLCELRSNGSDGFIWRL